MAIDVTAPDDDQGTLLAALPPDGTTVSNPTLLTRLGWDADRYYAARNALVDGGLVVRGRGRGGVVRRVATGGASEDHTVAVVINTDTDPITAAATVEAAIKNELALYEPMRKVIVTDWAKDHRRDPIAVEVTALQGRRSTGGTWSRPDIVSIEVRAYPYVPGKYLEVSTFEVKAANAINVQAVYEALAHRRAATHSYVLLHIPSDQAEHLDDDVADVAEAARAHGIGVVTAADPSDYETWEEREEARRVEPDPDRLNTFIATQLCDATRNALSIRLR